MLKDFFQRRSLEKHSSGQPTGLVPMKGIRFALVLLDADDPSFDKCNSAVSAFFRAKGIRWKTCSISPSSLKKQLNWYGRPKRRLMEQFTEGKQDLFISLLTDGSYAHRFIAAASPARFKAGRLDLPVFNLVFRDPEGRSLPERDAFGEMVKLLEKIK